MMANGTLACSDVASLPRLLRLFVVHGFDRGVLRDSGLELPCISTPCTNTEVWASQFGNLPDIVEWPWASIASLLLVALAAAAGMPTRRLRLAVLLTTAAFGSWWVTYEAMDEEEPPHGRMSQLHVFWHIASPNAVQSDRCDAIVRRQLRLLNVSGLLDRATIHLGLVGPVSARPAAVQELLAARHQLGIRVAARARRGHECVTTRALHDFATRVPSGRDVRVLYMHSRGTSRGFTDSKDVAAHAWTRMLENHTIERWREAVSAFDTPLRAATAGPELCPHGAVRKCRYQDKTSVWHYR